MTGDFQRRIGLQGKAAVVLGGGAFTGNAVSVALADAGASVWIGDVDVEGMEQTASQIREMGGDVHGMVCDVLDHAAVDAFYDKVEEQAGRLDIVVNVAGGTTQCKFLSATQDMIERDIRLNYGYVVQSLQRAIPLMQRGGRGGSIVNFTTIEAHRGAAGFSVYAGAKAATTNLTRALAVEFGADRIRLNCIAPDTTPTRGLAQGLPPEVRERMARLSPNAMQSAIEMYIPLKAPPSMKELADSVLFLVSDLSSSVTGTTLHVDGGTMASAGMIDWPYGDGIMVVPLAGTTQRLFGDQS